VLSRFAPGVQGTLKAHLLPHQSAACCETCYSAHRAGSKNASRVAECLEDAIARAAVVRTMTS